MTKEQKFYQALQDIFIGAKIEGTGGFVNLMRIKSNYYRKIEELLKTDVEKALKNYPSFRDELFDKLYSFFSRYFTESGSIYFNSTPFHNNIYEKVYTDEKDVILFWKTQMLYYVKTDRIFRSLPVEFDGFKFYFDASKIENKKANEKRSLVFELDKVKEDGAIIFNVQYSERGTKTKQDEILKALKKKGIAITEEQLERAFRIFEKQSEVDFFINKNAKEFLQEQFKLWSYQYFWDGAREWSADRVNQLQILKDIAFKIIDFISQFEDELVKIWNKPKFVKNSNYVITLDRITDKKIIEKIKKHKNYKEQVKEWKELGIDPNNPKATIDTKYFKDLELEILNQFDDLDKSLDGWLIKSENYQALNTILPKFKEKVQTIYIDPPFNTGDDFDYVDRFQDSTWLSLMNNRISISKQFLNKTGAIFVHLDHNAEHLGRILLDSNFKNGFINNIAWSYRTGGASKKNSLPYKHDSIMFFAKDIEEFTYKPIYERQYLEKSFMGAKQDEEGRYYTDTLLRDVIEGSIKDFSNNKIFNTRPVLNLSNEFYGFKTQKPEGLLYLLQYITSKLDSEIILDFFAGTGTSLAVAQKLNKKWIGIEMGEYINNFYVDEIELNNTEKNKKDLYKKFVILNYKEDGQKIRAIVKKVGILGRLKQVLSVEGKNEPCGITECVNWQGGGFFKYYELEQYEEALANTVYENHDMFIIQNKNPYEQYVFMKDEKMLKALEIDYENNKVKVDLNNLYSNIDIAETLSNLTGKWIKKISETEVEFEDGTKINTKDLDYKLIKPLIWWE